jgi:lysophospholipase L1-like esterase
VRVVRSLSFRLQNGGYASSGGPGQTFSSLYNLETPPGRVRLFWFNDQPEAWTVDAAAVAPTSAVHDGVTPVDADGRADPLLWRRITFRDAASGPDPHRLLLPAHTGPRGQPLLMMSDWIDVAGLARRDGGAGALLLVRCFSEGRIRYSGGGPPDPAIGRVYRAVWSGGNAAVPPYAINPADQPASLHACYGLQYTATVPGVSVIGIGDSIMASLRTTGSDSGYGFRACARMSSAALPVSYFNEGYSGRRSADFGTDGLRAIALLKPQAALIQAWSSNDPWTAAAADASFAMAMRVTEAARQAGCAPILVTAAPCFVHQPMAEQFRQASNARVREMARRGIPVLDVDAIWGTGDTPNAFRAQYDSGDRTHPNDAAAAAAAEALVPMLRRALGLV